MKIVITALLSGLSFSVAQLTPVLSPVAAPTIYYFNDDNVTIPTPNSCGNGICDVGETCLSCPSDCISGTTGGHKCGNDVCEDGEDCYSCPHDCNSELDEGNDSYCCYGGPENPNVPFAVSCKDADYKCGTHKGKCFSAPSPIVSYCCGDNVCSGEENELNCPIDDCVPLCGNGVCDVSKGENADNCGMDCPCNMNGICEEGETTSACPLDCTCGNYVCDYDMGETVKNCPHDCGCNANGVCEPWEDKKNCPMDNCYKGKESSDEEESESSDSGDKCRENGKRCQKHSHCCSFACDNVCVG